jgi:hypothetical protein
MRRFLTLLVMGLCLSACQTWVISAASALPQPLPSATIAPSITRPATWTPTATATATPRPTATRVRPTITPTEVEIEHQNRAAAKRPAATRTPATISAPPPPTVEMRVFAIGDSVMLGAARELKKTIAGIEVDAQVSRHIGATLSILQQRRAAGRLGQVVIVQIGNNGYVSAKQFDELMQLLADLPRVVIVNLKEPRKWEAANNQVMAEGVLRYPNAVLIDWHAYALAHPELFAKDGIHIGAAGAKAYTALVAAQVEGFVGHPANVHADTP